ncbi:hypothetical protein LVY74_13735 [Acinetobacter sp. ME22]|uniref:hypothetical protein n=1 Tax=Acinetobacter sp. ME22 TaxID=2904802 RepID=UPI001EDB3207|nr:hypothetical protein [Acinetobacter sp. ME22]MCG2574608.1 hypothetical protein [Acinetobacter sp. ME22]
MSTDYVWDIAYAVYRNILYRFKFNLERLNQIDFLEECLSEIAEVKMIDYYIEKHHDNLVINVSNEIYVIVKQDIPNMDEWVQFVDFFSEQIRQIFYKNS